MRLHQKKVLILGGSSGIGLETARLALDEGAEVTIVSHDPQKLALAREKFAGNIRVLVANACREAEVIRAIEAAGPIDHLIYTAGDEVLQKPIEDNTTEEMQSQFDVRFTGAAIAIKNAKSSIRAGGSIAMTSSTLPLRPAKGYAVGAGVSGAVNALARSLALELAPLRVNAVAPGVIQTPLWDRLPRESRMAVFSAIAQKLPVGRVGEPSDVAAAFLYLMTNDFVTGQVLTVDGGASLV